jgi:hypothetical protein
MKTISILLGATSLIALGACNSGGDAANAQSNNVVAPADNAAAPADNAAADTGAKPTEDANSAAPAGDAGAKPTGDAAPTEGGENASKPTE